MAKSAIPDALNRRHLLERQLQPAQARRIADAYLAGERRLEALDFLRSADAADGLAALRAQAIESGDAFLLRQVAEASRSPALRDEWLRLAEAAAAAGKERYAAEARRSAETAPAQR
jgi:hypothetical protein